MDKFIPTPEQEAILKCETSAIIDAGPGTGKTRTAIEKAFYELHSLDQDSRSLIIFLSFSNASVYRLMSAAKLKIKRKLRKGLRFRTYHAAAFEILKNYGRFVGLPSKIKVMDTLEEKLVALEKGWDNTLENYYDNLIGFAKENGMLSFQVILPLTCKLLNSSVKLKEIINRTYHLIIVDEFQDTSEEQWQFLKSIGDYNRVIAFGDPNQIIYSSLHAATEKRFSDFCEWKNIELSEFSANNFRCENAEILKFAKAFLRGKPYTPEKKSSVQFSNVQYRNRLTSNLALIWKNIFDAAEKRQTIGFLAPTNKIAEDAAIALRNPKATARVKIPVYVKVAKDEAAYDSVILALAAIRDYSITLDEESLKKAAMALIAMDLGWNTRKKASIKKLSIIKKLLVKLLSDPDSVLNQLFITCKTECNLNALLPDFISAIENEKEFKITCSRIKAHDRIKYAGATFSDPQLLLFDELRQGRKPKGLEGHDISEGKTHFLNYHKAKGREFDFTVMIVDPRGESTKIPIDEQRRLYYVCATRAKQFLGIIHYNNELGRVLGPVLKPAL